MSKNMITNTLYIQAVGVEERLNFHLKRDQYSRIILTIHDFDDKNWVEDTITVADLIILKDYIDRVVAENVVPVKRKK
jgi:hypothetical protein